MVSVLFLDLLEIVDFGSVDQGNKCDKSLVLESSQ